MEYKGLEVKTMEGWHRFADCAEKGGFDHYCKPGDLVDGSIFNEFLNILPPHRWSRGYLQVGEPHDISYDPVTGKYKNTWATFERIDKDVYMYLGNCFTDGEWDAGVFRYETIKEYLKNTYRVNPATEMQMIRPMVICKDGWSISVQASKEMYCSPREDINDGNYETVECGKPSEREELLMKYAEDFSEPKNTVYPYVPIEIVEEVIKKHGGVKKIGA